MDPIGGIWVGLMSVEVGIAEIVAAASELSASAEDVTSSAAIACSTVQSVTGVAPTASLGHAVGTLKERC